MITLYERLKRLLRYYYLRIIRLQGTPEAIAKGVTIGVFVGFTPTMPLHTILVFLLCLITRSNTRTLTAALLASVIVMNPITMIPIYSLSIMIGNLLTPWNVKLSELSQLFNLFHSGASFALIKAEIYNLGKQTIAVFLVGGGVLAVPLSIASYYASIHFFTNKQREKRKSK